MKRIWLGLAVAGALAGPLRGEVEEVYIDAEDGGRHAVIEAGVEGAAGRERLVVRIRPHGAGVEGEGGWKSRAGFNAHTAREMESVLRVEGFEVWMRGADGVLRPAEVAWEKSFASFPRRRLREDWSIDYLARTELLVSELTVETTSGLAGTDRLELRARGEARLQLDYDLASGRITAVRMPGHSRTVPVAVLVAEQEQEKEKVVPLPLADQWAEWKGEAKWKWYRKAVGDDVGKRGRLVEALRLAEDWVFLEQVALYSPGAFSTHSIGVILHEGKAPNWRRTVGWFGKVERGHSTLHTTSLLGEEDNLQESLGWLNKHAERLDENLKTLQATWTKQGVVPIEPAGDLPPWTEDDVFAPIALAFAEREDAVKDGTIATITRGIDGWAVSERWGSPWAEKVVDLIADREWRIAEAACLAFSHGTAAGVPMAQLWEVAQDGEKDQRLREAAFLGWSYGNWGEVFKVAHEIAEQPGHALWKPAVSRLGELGNGWTEQLFGKLAREDGKKIEGRVGFDAGQRILLEQERRILRARIGVKKHLSQDFEATAWATVLGYSRSADMEDWLLRRYGTAEFDTAASRKVLAKARGWAGDAPPAKVLEERALVRQRLIDELEFRWEQAGGKGAEKK